MDSTANVLSLEVSLKILKFQAKLKSCIRETTSGLEHRNSGGRDD